MKAQHEYFLARWLEGKMSDEQLRSLVGDQEFRQYVILRSALDSSQIAPPDIESNFARIKEKMSREVRPRIRRIPRYAVISALAACIVIGIVVFQALTFGKEITTRTGHHALVALPDGSQVTLNSASRFSKINLFTVIRKVKLDGEAFFNVSKGRPFTVQTPQGEIEVLGTSFNVISRGDYFEVVCYEGSVRVSTPDHIIKLKKGEAFRHSIFGNDNWQTDLEGPGWVKGESRFEKSPVGLVLMQLGYEYGYEVKIPESFRNTRFTGTFTRSDLTTALKSVLLPLDLQYEIEGKTIIVHP